MREGRGVAQDIEKRCECPLVRHKEEVRGNRKGGG